MAYNIQIVDGSQGVTFNAKYEKLDKAKSPSIEAKAPNGKVVKERTTYQGQVLGPGSTQRQWVDDDGNNYAKAELTFLYDGEPVSEITQTKVMQIEGYQDLSNYTDSYVISKFYEVFPSDNGMKKDIDRQLAVRSNLSSMRRLWEYLKNNNKVARGEFCSSSRGFVASDGYIRAVEFGNKWGLEIGVFKEEKKFAHLNEGVPDASTIPQAQTSKKLKMV
ncbi:MAG: hypothetical protein ACW99G_16910 [Candidatus Thorarchaeota archaeon]|jgi:hypothetical protein